MTSISVISRVTTAAFFAAFAWTAPAKSKPAREPATPSAGVKTPGVRIPFSSIEPEARISISTSSDWVVVAKADRAPAVATSDGKNSGEVPRESSRVPRGGTASAFVPGPGELQQIDSKTNKPGKTIAGLEKPCGGLATAFDSLWIPLCGTGVLARVDAKEYKVTAKIASGAAIGLRGNVAATADSIWALVDDKVTLVRIDPDSNSVIAELRLPAGCQSLTSGETALWVACPSENKVLRINPATNLVEKRIVVANQPTALAVGTGSVWALCAKDGKVDRIDTKTNKVTKSIELGVPGASGGLVFSEGSVWVSLTGFPLTRIDSETDTVAQQFYGTGGGAIDASPGALWVLQPSSGILLRIDPKLVLATLAE